LCWRTKSDGDIGFAIIPPFNSLKLMCTIHIRINARQQCIARLIYGLWMKIFEASEFFAKVLGRPCVLWKGHRICKLSELCTRESIMYAASVDEQLSRSTIALVSVFPWDLWAVNANAGMSGNWVRWKQQRRWECGWVKDNGISSWRITTLFCWRYDRGGPEWPSVRTMHDCAYRRLESLLLHIKRQI
jgi:hypothetical protein